MRKITSYFYMVNSFSNFTHSLLKRLFIRSIYGYYHHLLYFGEFLSMCHLISVSSYFINILKTLTKEVVCCGKNDKFCKCSFEAQFKNFCIFWKSHILFVRYSILHLLNHSINFESYDVMISIGSMNRSRVHFQK